MSILNFALQILPSCIFNMLVIHLGYSLYKVEQIMKHLLIIILVFNNFEEKGKDLQMHAHMHNQVDDQEGVSIA